MIPTPVRNFACAMGLVLGLSLIASASVAQAETFPCSPEDTAGVTEDGLPIICETMVITAPRRQSVVDRIRELDFSAVLPSLELQRDTATWTLEPRALLDVTN